MEEDEKPKSTMSKGAQLAFELSKEKARLTEELAVLQAENNELAPTTPTGTFDWRVKWLAMVLAVIGVFLISANLVFAGQVAYIFSGICWIYVGMLWSDRAIMIGSAITTTAVAMNFVERLLG